MERELCILNAGAYVRTPHLQRALLAAGVADVTAVSKHPVEMHAWVQFASAAARDAAFALLPTVAGPKCKFFSVGPVKCTHFGEPSSGGGGGGGGRSGAGAGAGGGGGPSASPRAAIDASAEDIVTPWHAVPYALQLSAKQSEMRDVLRALSLQLRAHILRRTDLPLVHAAAQAAGRRLAGHKRALPTAGGAEAEAAPPPPSAAAVTDLAAALPASAASILPAWLLSQPAAHEGMACALAPPRASPRTQGYRNKASFTIGADAAGAPTVGSRLSAFASGVTVGAPEGSAHLPAPIIAVAAAMTAFVRGSALPHYDLQANAGVWRGLTVRWAEATRGLMAIVLVNPVAAEGGEGAAEGAVVGAGGAVVEPEAISALAGDAGGAAVEPETVAALAGDAGGAVVEPEADAALAEDAASPPVGASSAGASASAKGHPRLSRAVYLAELERMTSALLAAMRSASLGAPHAPSDAPCGALSLYLQEYDGISQPPANHPHRLLGDSSRTIRERMNGLEFNIGPGSFFQVNTAAAEILYDLVRDFALREPAGEGAAAGGGAPSSAAGGSAASGAAEAGAPSGAAGESASGAAAAPSGSGAAAAAASAGGASAAAASADGAANVAASASSAATATALAAGVSLHAAALAGCSAAVAVSEPSPSTAAPPRVRHAIVDVCCGTGTIGLVCARHPRVTRVVGVELSEEAVADARTNAALNGVANATFVCARAEAAIGNILELAAGEAAGEGASASAAGGGGGGGGGGAPWRCTAIVDPPRSGLHASVIRALRTCRALKRVVYVSCNPAGSFIEDAIKLCAPQEQNSAFARGPALRPVAAAMVDLFPSTAHAELVVVFERD